LAKVLFPVEENPSMAMVIFLLTIFSIIFLRYFKNYILITVI